MAEDEAEDIGGISVSVRASNAQLPGDLAEADRLIEQHFAAGRTVKIRAILEPIQSQGGRGVGAPAAVAPQISSAPAAASAELKAIEAQMANLVRAMSSAPVVQARVRATGQSVEQEIAHYPAPVQAQIRAKYSEAAGRLPGETRAPESFRPHPEVEQATSQLADLQEAAQTPTTVAVDTSKATAEIEALTTVLTEAVAATRELVAGLGQVGAVPVSTASQGTGARGAGGRGGGRGRGAAAAGPPEEGDEAELRRKQLRDRSVGTSVNPAFVYTFDPNDEEFSGPGERGRATTPAGDVESAAYHLPGGEPGSFEERKAAAAATRQQQLAASAAARRQDREAAAAARAKTPVVTRQLDEDAQRQRSQQLSVPNSATIVGSASYRENEGGEARGVPAGGGGGGGAGLTRLTRVQQRARAEAFDQEQSQITAQHLKRLQATRQFEVDEEAQARTVASRVAATTGSGRTSRTLASGLGAIFGGTERRQFEAQARASQANRAVVSSGNAIAPLDNQLRELAKTYTALSKTRSVDDLEQAKAVRSQFLAIRRLPEYREQLAKVKDALKEQAAAQDELDKISSKGNVLRNLTAITAAGAAFGIALQAVDFGIKTLAPAIGDAIDQASGFGATSNKVTQALAQQTLAAHGNVDAVLAQTEAQAGLSVAASDALNSQLKLTTQVKAGAQAAGQAGGLYRAAIGTNQQAPQGLLGGYGGIGGGPLFAQQLGGGTGFAETIKSIFGDFTTATFQNTAASNRAGNAGFYRAGGGYGQPSTTSTDAQTPEQRAKIAQIAKDRQSAETDLNDAAKRGAVAMGLSADAAFKFGTITNDQVKTLLASNLPQELKDTAQKSNEALFDASGALVTTYKDAIKGLEQASVGQGITPPEQLGKANLAAELQRQKEAAANLPAIQSQQAYERPSQINLARRQTEYTIGNQLPAQAALAALANPNVPVGTGIARSDQGKVVGQLKAAQSEQQQLNAYYAQGQDIIENTYRPAIVQNFGQAAGQAFDQALNAVKQTGQAIASIQAGISNEQAQYQVAQYNFQLLIAKRNLSDIGGLVGKNLGAGESELGILEHQNLLLSRQGQQLQFNLSQRQINFQTALAGFQAPGITPEERQARIAEAKIEAEFAQKQLNIQKQQFANQVKIVDIGNLRQGADLVRQIGLLIRGRQVTIDTAGAEQRLLRLQQLQQQNVAKVSTYLSAVDKLTNQAFADIQQLEAAAGKALETVAVQVLAQFGIVLKGLSSKLNGIGSYYDNGKSGNLTPHFASGFVGTTTGKTTMTVGEAQGETVAILRNPRAVNGFGGNGGGSVVVQFNGDIHTDSQASLEKVTQAVVKALGKEASLKGLRGIG